MTKEIEIEGFGAFADAIEGIYNRPSIPATTGATAGDVLTLGSDGPEWAEAPKELPDTTGASAGDVLSLGSSGPEWATPAGGGGGAFIDTAHSITSGSLSEYSGGSYTATEDCCVVYSTYPAASQYTQVKIDNVTVWGQYGTLQAGVEITGHVFLKAGQTVSIGNPANYVGSYTVYKLL